MCKFAGILIWEKFGKGLSNAVKKLLITYEKGLSPRPLPSAKLYFC